MLENMSLNDSLEKFSKLPVSVHNMSFVSQNQRPTSVSGANDANTDKKLRDEIREKDEQITSLSKQITEVSRM